MLRPRRDNKNKKGRPMYGPYPWGAYPPQPSYPPQQPVVFIPVPPGQKAPEEDTLMRALKIAERLGQKRDSKQKKDEKKPDDKNKPKGLDRASLTILLIALSPIIGQAVLWIYAAAASNMLLMLQAFVK